ncbi:MAG: recombinase family protein [Reyranella sp.]|nr:MAG: recombinase family protein [Reyranella sp.]
MSLIGYARVSTDEQTTAGQLDELKAAGCTTLFTEHASGADRDRPELARAIAACRAGDVLLVVRLDRLARSVRHLLEVIEQLKQKGAGFRSLADPIDTTTPQGVFALQVLGAVAELERQLISALLFARMCAQAEIPTKMANSPEELVARSFLHATDDGSSIRLRSMWPLDGLGGHRSRPSVERAEGASSPWR